MRHDDSTQNGPTTDFWFKRRRFGWGWVPVTWQGWMTVVGYLVVVIGAGFILLPMGPSNGFTPQVGVYFAVVTVATVTLIAIGLRTGPRPRWRWGRRPDDDPAEDW